MPKFFNASSFEVPSGAFFNTDQDTEQPAPAPAPASAPKDINRTRSSNVVDGGDDRHKTGNHDIISRTQLNSLSFQTGIKDSAQPTPHFSTILGTPPQQKPRQPTAAVTMPQASEPSPQIDSPVEPPHQQNSITGAHDDRDTTPEVGFQQPQIEAELDAIMTGFGEFTSDSEIDVGELDSAFHTIIEQMDSTELDTSLSSLFDNVPTQHQAAESAKDTKPLAYEQFDHIISHFGGNNRDRDDIAALPVAAVLTYAAGLQDKSTFFYNNHVGQPSIPDFVYGMRQSAAFAETLGIQTVDYDAGIDEGIQTLAAIFNSGQTVLVLEGGHMEMTYRALEKTDPANLSKITLLSHSKFNEDYAGGGSRTWSHLKRGFPSVTFIEISNQALRFHGSLWGWLDETENSVLQNVRTLMQQAQEAKDTPSDAGMHFYLLTGNEKASPPDVEGFLRQHLPELDPDLTEPKQHKRTLYLVPTKPSMVG